jgi:predicted alpha/beta-hydrolase family hydrolase
VRIEIETASGTGWADLERPRGARALLVLTHGAGGGVETPDLLAIAAAAGAARVATALVTQPYRVAGRRTPPQPGPQDAAWLQIVSALRKRRGLGALPLVLGGRSNGARVACRTAREAGATAVVALAFPLHPPPRATPPAATPSSLGVPPSSHAGGPPLGHPEKSRLDELAGAGVTTLVVQGERDPFGMPPRGRGRRVVVVPGADHTLKRDPAAVATAVIEFVTSLAVHDRLNRHDESDRAVPRRP